MKLRLLSVLLAATSLTGCATYDYAGGAAGGYYHGRPSVDYYGGYGGGYGYGYGYPLHTYSRHGYGPYGPYGGYGRPFYSPYYGGHGYYPYYPYPRHYVRPPRPDGDPDDEPQRRPPPWRAPDGRYLDSGQVMMPPRIRRMEPGPATQARPGTPMTAPRPMVAPRPASPPAPQRVERAYRQEQPAPSSSRSSGSDRIRTHEN